MQGRRLWAAGLVTALALLLAACGSAPAPEESGEESQAKEPPPATSPSEPEPEVPPEAANFPERTITIVVPYAAGGRTDIITRIAARHIEEELGVPVIVENLAGAGGMRGVRSVINADQDGYTLGVMGFGIVFAQWTQTPPMDFNDIEIIGMGWSGPLALGVRADSGWETLDDYLQAAEKQDMRHAVGSVANSAHVLSELLFREAGADVTIVPYEGDAGTVEALLRGETQSAMPGVVPLIPHMEEGNVRVLAVTLPERHELFEGLPTFVEYGYEDLVIGDFPLLYAPGGTPPAIVAKLEESFGRVFTDNPELEDEFGELYNILDWMGSREVVEFLEQASPKYEALIEELGLKVVN